MVWHRWIRNEEGRELGWDLKWIEEHIVDNLIHRGANTLRFHLGMPPEAILDLCDRRGLLVQAEWLFFHGMKASTSTLWVQWREWLTLCLRHPSVVLHHPWNESEGDELKPAFEVIEELSQEFPKLIISHRDVCHVHKYWWSLFENVGCKFDHADQFPQPIMVDEFGGNYLDGEGNPGGYPALEGCFSRFLGHDHNTTERLRLNEEANARVAEYWRRIDAAGFSPFCMLASWEDGNHHFLGPSRRDDPRASGML